MVVLNQDSIMYQCRVLYIGSSAPIETLKGLDAMQEPLRQRYPKQLDDVKGIDANICVLPDALELRYIASDEVVQFPLDRMTICAGVRAVNVVDGTTGEMGRQFVPVNTVQQDSANPAIFAAIIRRKVGREIAECHMFICNSTRDALHLVNAAATANMALKKQRGQTVGATNGGNDVIVIRPEVQNGYTNGGYNSNNVNYETQSFRQVESEPVVVNSGTSQIEAKHFKIQQSTVEAPEPDTIYIKFDKTNLVATGDNTLEVKNTSTRQTRKTEEYSRPTYVEAPDISPRPALRPVQVPYVGVPTPRQAYTLQHMAAPPPRPQPVLMQRPQPVLMQRPQPVIMQRPVLVRPPPPPPMMFRPPQRLYTKRVIAAPPPQQRFVSQPPIYSRSRARSASPIGRYSSEIRYSRRPASQPMWVGGGRTKSDIAPRMSRRDRYERPPPPPQQNLDFFQQAGAPREMYLNERAFSRRMHSDNRITREHTGYHYPTAYDLNDAMLYDRPTTKSNPRYSSSSSSSDDGFRNNRLRSSRR